MQAAQIAAQLFTVREHARDASGLAATLRRIRSIGYTAVQLSGVVALPESEINRMLDGEGLVCCATHEPGDKILNEPAAIIARLQALRCRLTAYAFPAGIDLAQPAQVEELTRRLEASAVQFKAAGLTLGYHNHDIEFLPHRGRPVLEHIFGHTRHLVAELDTYWVQAGGGDVVRWIERLAGRLPSIHLKDYGMKPPRSPYFAEIGSGNLDWHRILPAAQAAGCQWFIVERDHGDRDPFDSLKASYDYLRGHFARD